MRKLAIAVALSTTVLAGPALARDGAWYVGGEFGAMIVEDSDTTFTPGTTAGTTGTVGIGFEEGFDGAGFIGYDFGAFRVEAEVAYKQADVEEITTNGLTAPGTAGTGALFDGGNGDISILSGMVNAMLDFGDDDGLSGFVGGGVGMARVDINSVTAFTNTGALIDDSDTRFAWQLFAGVRQALSRTVDIHLKYRFFNVDELEYVGFGARSAQICAPTRCWAASPSTSVCRMRRSPVKRRIISTRTVSALRRVTRIRSCVRRVLASTA
jgi:OOP family OmpA-OmpF porin